MRWRGRMALRFGALDREVCARREVVFWSGSPWWRSRFGLASHVSMRSRGGRSRGRQRAPGRRDESAASRASRARASELPAFSRAPLDRALALVHNRAPLSARSDVQPILLAALLLARRTVRMSFAQSSCLANMSHGAESLRSKLAAPIIPPQTLETSRAIARIDRVSAPLWLLSRWGDVRRAGRVFQVGAIKQERGELWLQERFLAAAFFGERPHWEWSWRRCRGGGGGVYETII